jgi:secreted trypsin-like serine protease
LIEYLLNKEVSHDHLAHQNLLRSLNIPNVSYQFLMQCFLGDSGGGIGTYGAVNGKPRMILYGVVSNGIECEKANVIYPGIYTDVRYYLDWILDNMS